VGRVRDAARDDPAFRMTVFDAGNGLLSFYADDTAEIIEFSISPGSADVRRHRSRIVQPLPARARPFPSLAVASRRSSRVRAACAFEAIHTLVPDDGL
jgi:hypothetical protein